MKRTILLTCIPIGCLVLLAVALLEIGTLDGVEGGVLYLSGSDKTTYSSNYTEMAFLSVKVGMPEDEVRTRLGDPLFIGSSDQTHWWTYSKGNPSRRREIIVIHGKVTDITTGVFRMED